MSDVTIAVEKMHGLSPERVARVVALIEHLSTLEVLEDAEDAAAARAGLKRHELEGGAVSLDELVAQVLP